VIRATYSKFKSLPRITNGSAQHDRNTNIHFLFVVLGALVLIAVWLPILWFMVEIFLKHPLG
jgi:hypothetical protein